MSENPTRNEPSATEAPSGRARVAPEDIRPEPSAAEQAVANERAALESGEENSG